MIFCKDDIEEVLAIKRLLTCFQMVSGLKINFHKSPIIGVRADDLRIEEYARKVCCKMGTLPITYLGLPLGANPRST